MAGVFVVQVFDDLTRECPDDRRYENGLRDDHCGRRIKQFHPPQRTGAREHQIHAQANNHRRKTHQRIQQNDRGAAPAKSRHADHRTERQTENAGNDHCRQTHLQ
jgi:hypothetical protein